jgi:hypothetical protein
VSEKVKVARPRLVLCLLPTLLLVACSQKSGPRKPSPAAILQAIPSADPAKYGHLQNTRNWRNPYLIIRPDGVALYDTADSAEIILKPEQVIGALAQLPRSNWPYGRVVAATEIAAASDQDGVAIRRNKGLVGGLLEEANVTIRWVPES